MWSVTSTGRSREPNPGQDAEKQGRQTGKYKKVCSTDPDATMATNARNRRLEPTYKHHAAVDDLRGVILDIEVTTGESTRAKIVGQVDATMATTGVPVTTVTADAGYAYAKVYGALERRGIEALIPTKAEPIRSPVPLRRFRYDAKHDIVKCPRGKILGPAIRSPTALFLRPKRTTIAALWPRSVCRRAALERARDQSRLLALLRARRRRERWSAADQRLYQRHRWRSESFHGESRRTRIGSPGQIQSTGSRTCDSTPPSEPLRP